MKLPPDLQEALSDRDYALVATWWDSLSTEQQNEICDVSTLAATEFAALPMQDEQDADDPMSPFFDYLINHEWRIVNFVAEPERSKSYRIVSSYLASLGSDYRHGGNGSVW